ncbi:MAG: hypothetical protein RL264_1661 [Bacteroidota bacterium]|jgi:hypothetical protein
MFKFRGTVKLINPTQQVSEKFSKRDFVISDNTSMYPQHIQFQMTQDKCALLDTVQVNDEVEVSFYLRGREWQSPQGDIRYFNTLDAFRVEKVGQANAMPSGGPTPMAFGSEPMSAPVASTSSALESSAEDDDLPF